MFTLVMEDVVEVPIVWRGGAAAVNSRIKNWNVSNWTSNPTAWVKEWTL